jgi:ATP-dependent RNA helicase DeaD
VPSEKDQLVKKAILWARKVSKEKPVSPEKITEEEWAAFRQELTHLSKDELLSKLLATYLREQQG